MPNLRYMGSSGVDLVVTDDKGKFKEVKRIRPRDEIEFDDTVAERFLRGPRYLRLWVEVGSVEDPESNDYLPSRYDSVSGNASPYPELDMGSTVQPRKVMFRTHDDNPEGYDIADPSEGTPSDNAKAIAEERARMEGAKAAEAARNRPAVKAAAENKPNPDSNK